MERNENKNTDEDKKGNENENEKDDKEKQEEKETQKNKDKIAVGYPTYSRSSSSSSCGPETLAVCVAEVTNTPWGERVVFNFNPAGQRVPKALHVSPFMDMRGGDPTDIQHSNTPQPATLIPRTPTSGTLIPLTPNLLCGNSTHRDAINKSPPSLCAAMLESASFACEPKKRRWVKLE